jgi:PIN domain nuclease of toxin-antitoxin system
MRLLLDTHLLLWTVMESGRLGPATRGMLEDSENEILFSAVSIWEIAIKAGLSRGDFPFHPDEILEAALGIGFIELPVYAAIAARVANLPHHHRDPFDRLLIAQAMSAPAHFLTADRLLLAYSDLVTLV